MLNPEKYINEKRLEGHRRKKLERLKWSPELGKYVLERIIPQESKKQRREAGDKNYRRYKIGDGLFLRTYPDGLKEIWEKECLWRTGQEFPERTMISYYHLDHKYLKRKAKYGW